MVYTHIWRGNKPLCVPHGTCETRQGHQGNTHVQVAYVWPGRKYAPTPRQLAAFPALWQPITEDTHGQA
jgi:hypothetical protein